MSHPEKQATGQDIYTLLKEDILTLKLAPGASLSENELARQYGVSRTPIKAAFLRLMSENLVEIRPQRGTYVTLLDLDKIREAIHIRTLLETEVLHAAADGMTPALAAAAEANLAAQGALLAAPFEPKAFFELDAAFHRAFFGQVGRAALWEIIDDFQVYYTRFRVLDLVAAKSYAGLLAEHRELLAALVAGDKPAVSEILARHLTGNLKRLKQTMESELREYFLVR